MKTDNKKKPDDRSVQAKKNREKTIPEFPLKKKQVPNQSEEIMEDEEPLPEIEKTHKHIHKVQTPVAGIKNNKTTE